jgi:hypothetical protein
MQFFKEIIDGKLGNPEFRSVYEKECHICSATLKVIERLEEEQGSISRILNQLNISQQAYEDLKNAENCDPKIVIQLHSHFGLKVSDQLKRCKKNK